MYPLGVLLIVLLGCFLSQPVGIMWRRHRSGQKLIRPTPAPFKHHVGDCTDEMFEAMREVDAMGLSGDPLLVGRLPPRDAYPVRFDRPGTFVEMDCRPEQAANWVRIVEPDGAELGGFEIEFDPISGKTRTL